MNKSLPLLLIGLASCIPALGKGSASPITLINAQRLIIEQSKKYPSNKGSLRATAGTPTYIPAIVRLESATSQLPDFILQLARRDDLALVTVPATRIEEVLSAPGVLRMESGICASPAMNLARGFCRVDEAATSLPISYTGRGVVLGFADTGFDPNHITFKESDNDASRVKRVVDYTTGTSEPTRLLTPEEISSWSTDNPDHWHATHVAGIMAGGYMENGFHGVARNAHIVATTSPLYDAYLLAGLEETIDYARSVSSAVPVVNMSVSSVTGPHDGTTLFNQYLERIAGDAVVCISAGNDGQKWGGFFPYTYAPRQPKVQALCREHPLGSPYELNGIVDVWSIDSRPVTARLIIYDSKEKRVTHTFNTVDLKSGITDVSLFTPDYSGYLPGNPNLALSNLFDSAYARFSCEINPENGRYNVVFSFDWRNRDKDGRYWMGIEIEGEDGSAAEAYASSGINFMVTGDEYSPRCSNRRSINDLACGEGIAVVGAMVSRRTDGQEPGSVAHFTSFGTLNDGRRLPSFCAPGAGVVSSVSTPFYQNHPEETKPEWGNVAAEGRDNYWDIASGTSMSSPFAAGVFALWLEANPELKPCEVIEIARSTLRPAPDSDSRWGAGILDAYAGLTEALRYAGITEVSASSNLPLEIHHINESHVRINSFTTNISQASVTDISGKCIMSLSPCASECDIDISVLNSGFYIISASNGIVTETRKIYRR